MIIKNPEEKKELDKIPNVDEKGDPIYKIDEDLSEKTTDDLPDENQFKDTLQDLKNETSQD